MDTKELILTRITPEMVYGELKRTGRTLRRLCPFHAEKTPSFVVYPDGSFHCFGCNKSGDYFDFIMSRDGVDFPTALKTLAALAGVEAKLDPAGSSSSSSSKCHRLFEVNKAALQFFSENLQRNADAMEYLLKDRAIDNESIERFHLGYTNGSSSVSDYLLKKGFTRQEIIDSGLAKEKGGRLKDFFFDMRIIFPIIFKGKPLGFGGRVISGEGPKYLNTQETLIFKKGETLYGMDPDAITQKGCAIIVEGYFDVIRCHQHGYTNTVATLGTVLKESHVGTLKKYTNTFYIVFDGDKAGNTAAEVASKMLFDLRVKGGVIVLPDNEDPDTYLRSGNRFEPLIERALPFSVFLSKRFPQTRKMLFHSLLTRSSIEVAEFLAYLSTPEEIGAFEEINARRFASNALKTAKVVVRKNDVEVKKFGDYLILFAKKRFIMEQKIKEDFKKQAMDMLSNFLKIKRNAQKTKYKEE